MASLTRKPTNALLDESVQELDVSLCIDRPAMPVVVVERSLGTARGRLRIARDALERVGKRVSIASRVVEEVVVAEVLSDAGQIGRHDRSSQRHILEQLD